MSCIFFCAKNRAMLWQRTNTHTFDCARVSCFNAHVANHGVSKRDSNLRVCIIQDQGQAHARARHVSVHFVFLNREQKAEKIICMLGTAAAYPARIMGRGENIHVCLKTQQQSWMYALAVKSISFHEINRTHSMLLVLPKKITNDGSFAPCVP